MSTCAEVGTALCKAGNQPTQMKSFYRTWIYFIGLPIVLLLSSHPAVSQYNYRLLKKKNHIYECFKRKLKIEFGIKAGVTVSGFTTTPDILCKNVRLGYTLGGFARIPLKKHFFFQPEILHTSKGARIMVTPSGNVGGEYTVDLNYIEAPFALGVRLDRAMHLYVGGYVAGMIAASSHSLSRPDNDLGIRSFSRDDFRTFDYGVLGGIGVDIKKLTFGMRYSSGLSVIGRNSLLHNVSNNSLSVYLSLLI